MVDDACAWFGPIPSKSQVVGSDRGQKNVTFWSAHKQTCRVDIDGERRGGCINESSKLEEIQQSTRVNDSGGGGVGGGRRRRSGHRSRDERDGEAGIGAG